MTIKHRERATKPTYMNQEEIQEALHHMEQDSGLDTKPVLINNPPYPAEHISFFKKHLGYLLTHPKVNPEHYLTNLRTMIKIRR